MPTKSCARLRVVALVLGWMRQKIHHHTLLPITFTYRFHSVHLTWAAGTATFRKTRAAETAANHEPHWGKFDERVKSDFFDRVLTYDGSGLQPAGIVFARAR